MKAVTVSLQDGNVIHAHGDPMLDAVERSLIISGKPGTYVTFNWAYVSYYVVSPSDDCEAEEDDEEF